MQFSGDERCYFGWLLFLWFDPKSISVSGTSFTLKGQHAPKGLQDWAELVGQMYLSGYYEDFYELLVKNSIKFYQKPQLTLTPKMYKSTSKISEFLLQNDIRVLLKNAQGKVTFRSILLK